LWKEFKKEMDEDAKKPYQKGEALGSILESGVLLIFSLYVGYLVIKLF